MSLRGVWQKICINSRVSLSRHQNLSSVVPSCASLTLFRQLKHFDGCASQIGCETYTKKLFAGCQTQLPGVRGAAFNSNRVELIKLQIELWAGARHISSLALDYVPMVQLFRRKIIPPWHGDAASERALKLRSRSRWRKTWVKGRTLLVRTFGFRDTTKCEYVLLNHEKWTSGNEIWQ